MDAVDGRHARRERNRDAVIAATVELLEQGTFTPTAQEIADRAGVSLRSVFRYHDNLDTLVAAAGVELMEQRADEMVYQLPERDTRGLVERIDDLVEHAGRFYERNQSFARVANRRAYTDPQYAEIVRGNRQAMAEVIATLFAPELDVMTPEQRRAAIADVHTTLMFTTWDSLMGFHELTFDEATVVARRRMLSALQLEPALH